MQLDTGSCQVLEVKKKNPHDSIIDSFNQPHSISKHPKELHEADGYHLGQGTEKKQHLRTHLPLIHLTRVDR